MRDKMSDQECRKLIKIYQDTNDEKVFDILYKNFRPMIAKIVSKHSYDNDELLSEANQRFIEAIRRFDHSIPTKVVTYVYAKINLDIKCYLKRHAPLMGKRSGAGTPSNIYHEDIDSIRGIAGEELGEGSPDIIKRCIFDCVQDVLEPEELNVIMRFFGLGFFDEPTYDRIQGGREDEVRFSKRVNKWVQREVPVERKLSRVAKSMGKSRDKVAEIYEMAINKLKSNPDMINLCGELLIENKLQFERSLHV